MRYLVDTIMKRKLGKSGIEVSAMGLGCWAIGGLYWRGDKPLGWEDMDDKKSTDAIHRAIDLGITFFDTAAVYGVGHSEGVLGRALKGRRDKVVIASKFGYTFDVMSREVTGINLTPEHIRQECHESLRRLESDYIDLYLIHVGSVLPEEAEFASVELDRLCEEGYIRSFGWSTDDIRCAGSLADNSRYTAVEHELNVLNDAGEILGLCEEYNLVSINRTPLAMGLLAGELKTESQLLDDSIRGNKPKWIKYFKNEKPSDDWLEKFHAVRDVLTSGGRTLAQGALAWIWARSKRTIPIPGFRTVEQVEENAGAMQFGPLPERQMQEIDFLLGK
jgi:aryl-alcohol dehydrogenase-like predicted oxidoreductase